MLFYASPRPFLTRLALLATVACAASPLSAQKVHVDYQKSHDFSGLTTYDWRVHPIMEADPELRASVGAELVRMAVSRELLDRGFIPADGAAPDFYVTGFGTRGKHSEVVGSVGGWYNSGPYYAQGWNNVMVRDYVDGTLVLDIIDAKTDELVWRAYCQGAVSNPSKRHKTIDKILKKAFDSFPARPAP